MKHKTGFAGCLVALLAIVASTGGCPFENVGVAHLPFTGDGDSGALYRLRSGTFQISGIQDATLNTEDHLGETVMQRTLEQGAYVVQLQDGWYLEREISEGVFEPVDATLTSEDPAAFVIEAERVTTVTFWFAAGDDVIELRNGTVDITIGVHDQPDAGTRSWGSPERFEASGTPGSVRPPQIATAPTGNALAVWMQRSDDPAAENYAMQVLASHYAPGVGWSSPEFVQAAYAGIGTPQVSMDACGNGIAVWAQFFSDRRDIFASRYVTGTGWGTPELIEIDNAGNASDPQIAVNAAGNAVAVWYQWDGVHANIWSNRYTVESGWGSAQLIETDDAGDAVGPQVAMDASGNAPAIWRHYDGAASNCVTNSCRPGIGWGTAERIEAYDGATYAPQIAMDASGNGLAVWRYVDESTSLLVANRFEASTGWSTPEVIQTNDGRRAYNAQVAMDGAGNAVVVWMTEDDQPTSTRYLQGIAWGSAETIAVSYDRTGGRVAVDVDSSRNAVAVWTQFSVDNPEAVWTSRFTTSSGWGGATRISNDTTLFSRAYPQVAIDPSGNVFAVWQEDTGIWTNSYR